MFDTIIKHGCADLSSQLHPSRYSDFAIATGGFGDVWQARMSNGTLVAVNCLRLHDKLEGDPTGMEVRTSASSDLASQLV